jgi:glycosyltransferase involved in cell wall biosynthesis
VHLSIIIPTFNRAGLLVRTIPALVDQERGDFSYEVIFVSNGSSDESGAILETAVARHPDLLRYFWIPPTGGPSAPRNVGIRAATGDVIVILDDDVVPEPDLVRRHAEFHAEYAAPHHAALGEVYVPPDMLDDPMTMFHEFPYGEVRHLERLRYFHFWTCNVSVKRQFMLDHGMFDEVLRGYEDVLCGHRLMSGGMHLHFLPSARGQHLHQLKPSGVATKGIWYGRWLYVFLERLPERALKERFGILSLDLGVLTFATRAVKRAAFHLVDNPLTHACLRALGATRPRRSRFSDLYYFLLFRRNVLRGYAEARRLRRAPDGLMAHVPAGAWFDRGE